MSRIAAFRSRIVAPAFPELRSMGMRQACLGERDAQGWRNTEAAASWGVP